jgi:hypothetical protein
LTKLKSSLREKIKELPFPFLYFVLFYQEISVYAPNILPISDLTIVRVGPLSSQQV